MTMIRLFIRTYLPPLAENETLNMPYKNNILSFKILMVLTLTVISLNGRLKAAQPDIERRSHPTENISEDVSAVEDLMREHGLLGRILLIYEKELKDIEAGKGLSYHVLFKAANIVRGFVENYHEKLEEDYIFPRFEKTGKLFDLVKVLREQHQAGRGLTDTILEISKPEEIDKEPKRHRLRNALSSFIAMYRPHKAREDTVLFPALHSIVPQKEYEELGERFEEKEHQLFGQNGFENMVRAISALEKELNIYDLSGFTAKIEN